MRYLPVPCNGLYFSWKAPFYCWNIRIRYWNWCFQGLHQCVKQQEWEICFREMHLGVFCFSERCHILALFQYHELCMINSSARSHALFHFQEVPNSRAENQSSFSRVTKLFWVPPGCILSQVYCCFSRIHNGRSHSAVLSSSCAYPRQY